MPAIEPSSRPSPSTLLLPPRHQTVGGCGGVVLLSPETSCSGSRSRAWLGRSLGAAHRWRPILGRPQLHDTPAGTSDSAVPDDALSVLAVLRRPQTSRDRNATARRLLRVVGQQFAGVPPDSVRLLTLTPGHHALVLSARRVGRAPGAGAPGQRDPVCLFVNAGAASGGAATRRRGARWARS
jgi:hypothetical protein